jgi:hypothetical protein
MDRRNETVLILLVGAVVLWVWLEFAFQRRLLNDLATIVYHLEDRLTTRFSDLGTENAKRTI